MVLIMIEMTASGFLEVLVQLVMKVQDLEGKDITKKSKRYEESPAGKEEASGRH